jgi:hypothetical protein
VTAADANANPEHDLELAKYDMRQCRDEVLSLRARIKVLQDVLKAITEGLVGE